MAIPVKLEAFEGPLDLLLHLIDKNKIDIYDIPIVEITDQYFQYIKEMKEFNMDVASEFMLMAATLLDIKCQMLLPKEEEEPLEEDDPRAELVRRLMEYKTYKYMSEILKQKMEDTGVSLTKEATLPKGVEEFRPPVDVGELLKDVSLDTLMSIYKDVLRRKEDRRDTVRGSFGKIEKEKISVGDRMRSLEVSAIKKRKLSFREFLENQNSRLNIVVSFLAVLELMHYGKIRITQEKLFDEIVIESLEATDAVPDESIFASYDTEDETIKEDLQNED